MITDDYSFEKQASSIHLKNEKENSEYTEEELEES